MLKKARISLILLASGLLGIWVGRLIVPSPGKLVATTPHVEWNRLHDRTPGGEPRWPHLEVTNVGGKSVRVLGIQTSCGCTQAKIEPTQIGPGKKGFVSLQVTPPSAGERLVMVTLNTDSPLTPEVGLKVRVGSSRTPPYLLSVSGEIVYNSGDDVLAEDRDLEAITIDVAGARPGIAPEPTCDLDYVHIGTPTMVEAADAATGTVVRKYRYKVRIVDYPPTDHFSGVIKVRDPWDADSFQAINVHGINRGPFRIVPSPLFLRVQGPSGPGRGASFQVLSDRRLGDLRVEPMDAESCPLEVDSDSESGDDGGQCVRFVVTARPGSKLLKNEYKFVLYETRSHREKGFLKVYIVRDG